MPITIGQPVDHGFDEPIGLLSDCHRRIERFLEAMLQIAGKGRGGRLEPQDQEALSAALHYFRAAAPRHTADEEESLFPRLRQSQAPQTRAALALLDRLEADHRVADAHHQRVDALGHQWLAENTLPPEDVDVLQGHLGALRELYRAHIAVEDEQLFPAASRVLASTDIEAIGREMARRRGVAW